jgi:ubiquinone/menaquinone biosynthesis C-methylase UbiE
MADRRHRARLERGKRAWNIVSHTHGAMSDRTAKPLNDMALKHLKLTGGEAVVDIGCGTGAMLAALRDVTGPDGRVVGVDHSPRMVARTRKLIQDKGWTNVEVRRQDASRDRYGHEEYDAAVALASFSAMPDVPAAVALAHEALRPGGRLFVFDLRLVPSGNLFTRTVTRALRWVYRVAAGFSGADVRVELERTFAKVEPVVPDVKGRTRMTLLLATK